MGTAGRTVGRLMSRTVIWLVVAGAVVIAVGLGVAWQGKLSDRAVLEQALKPAASNPQAAAANSPMPSAPPPAGQPAAMTPSFDVARIGPDGRAVVAGRATPGAKIVLLNGGKEIARGEADSHGEWVLLIQ